MRTETISSNSLAQPFWRNSSLLLAWIASSTSGACVLAAAFGWMSLAGTVTMLAPLSAVLFAVAIVRTGRGREDILLRRIAGGLAAGFVGLVAYDLVRLIVFASGQVSFNPFRPIEVFGL